MEETKDRPFEAVTLRDVDIKTALVIPHSNDGVETVLFLQKPTDKLGWYRFSAESFADEYTAKVVFQQVTLALNNQKFL